MLHKLFQGIEKRGNIFYLFYEASITLILKLVEDIVGEEHRYKILKQNISKEMY